MTVEAPPSTLANPLLTALFAEARNHVSAWEDRPLPPGTVEALYEAMRQGPTSGNCQPARLVFVETAPARERLMACVSSANREKMRGAPLTVIVATDPLFYDHLDQTFPLNDARSWFTSSPELARETAFRNGTLQGAYLILAARALGLTANAMSGFKPDLVREAFLAAEGWEPNFLISIGHAAPATAGTRLPRLDFATACRRI